MPVLRIQPAGVAKATGYSHVVKAGNTVYVSGQVALDEKGTAVGKGDAGAQTEQVFKNMEACLASAGATMKDLAKITTYVVGAANLPAVRAVRARHLAGDAPPASTLVVVSGLANPDFLVEVEAIAVVG